MPQVLLDRLKRLGAVGAATATASFAGTTGSSSGLRGTQELEALLQVGRAEGRGGEGNFGLLHDLVAVAV